MNISEKKIILLKAAERLKAALEQNFKHSIDFNEPMRPEKMKHDIDGYVVALASISRVDPDLHMFV